MSSSATGLECVAIGNNSSNSVNYSVLLGSNTTTLVRPSTDVVADLGAPANQFKTLYCQNILYSGLLTVPFNTIVANTSTGAAGEVAWDANYVYVCTATNTWKRIALDATPW